MMRTEPSGQRILVIDDEANMRHMLAAVLTKAGYEVESAPDGESALRKVELTAYDFILCDIKMPVMSGMDFLRAGGERIGQSTVIMMSAYGNIDTAIDAMKRGAYDYISKPFKPDEVLLTLKKAEERESLRRENRQLKARIEEIEKYYRFGNMVAKSRAMISVFQLAQKAARYSTTVLILGESGTGKELIAKTIHGESDRKDRLFLPIDCSALSETIIESELFGHVKGAFTGADRTKKGLLEEAHGGTIFLDEVGNLGWQVQSKLLRFLQEREIKPVGASKVMKIDVRVISATNTNLRKEIENGRFREDLFYRLSGIEISVPPLRDRIEDIAYLVDHFIHKYSKDLGKKIDFIENEALEMLQNRRWSGNVRELEHLIEYALVVEKQNRITANTVFHILPESKQDLPSQGSSTLDLNEAVNEFERLHILKVIGMVDNNKAKASRLLGVSRSVLYEKLKKYRLE